MSGAGKKRKATTSASASAPASAASSDSEVALTSAAKKKVKATTSTNGSSSASAAAAGAKKNNGKGKNKASNDGYEPLTLPQIRVKIAALGTKVPSVPPSGLDHTDSPLVRKWAQSLQSVIEEFNLLLCCVSSATYKWGSDRSGAADQNLGVLSSELGNAQDQISSSVTPRLTNVLAPVVDLVIAKTVTTKKMDPAGGTSHTPSPNGSTSEKADEQTDPTADSVVTATNTAATTPSQAQSTEIEVETKVNHFVREQVDPAFLLLCNEILCRNASMLRQVVLANFHKIDRVIGDYEKATKKDAQHDGRGFAY
eukprot:CAMPEP_0113531482 /NCGR_PEP_ID=MMETSP0015_2-20120614/3520_1 /TAXON_ID=2838 /ORGANISM="Odontella" /LENGTH=310 /DNA_ID=CAMNT_0000430321 /DNA_START=19 /DNA_END=952 /DNA_ORIENTATION=+ /assembly_acc=CAM_ASM_000160